MFDPILSVCKTRAGFCKTGAGFSLPSLRPIGRRRERSGARRWPRPLSATRTGDRDRDRPPRARPRHDAGKPEPRPRRRDRGSCSSTGRRVGNAAEWLRVCSCSPTRSQRSPRDRFSAFAPSRKCECLRIQVVGRSEPGRSPLFAPSRDEGGGQARRVRQRWPLARRRGARGPAVPRRRGAPRGRNGRAVTPARTSPQHSRWG